MDWIGSVSRDFKEWNEFTHLRDIILACILRFCLLDENERRGGIIYRTPPLSRPLCMYDLQGREGKKKVLGPPCRLDSRGLPFFLLFPPPRSSSSAASFTFADKWRKSKRRKWAKVMVIKYSGFLVILTT